MDRKGIYIMALPSELSGFTFNHANQIDTLYQVYTSAQIKDKFDSQAEELRVKLNEILTALASTTDSDSGADNIGVTPISGVTGTTVQLVLESLKGLLDLKGLITDYYSKSEMNSAIDGISGSELTGARAIVGVDGATVHAQITDIKAQQTNVILGLIPDGTLTEEKLSSDIIRENLNNSRKLRMGVDY